MPDRLDAQALPTTAHLADACLRAGVPVRCAPAALRPVVRGTRIEGRALPARHFGSVDVFLEAIERSRPGDVLVVDNAGRLDESCVGGLVVREAQAAQLAAVVIWGLHRDTADIMQIGLPVFSLGAIPTGPLRLDAQTPDALEAARIADWTITAADTVVADDDGVLFLPTDDIPRLVTLANGIRETEQRQARLIAHGRTLRDQLAFAEYLSRRAQNPALTFREHLRSIGGAIEE